MTVDLDNKVALVLAGADGIGKACATILAQNGVKVYIADWQEELAKVTAKEISQYKYPATGLFFNAFENETYQMVINHILKIENRIDILINNFGGTNPQHDLDLAHTDIIQWEKDILSNINSVFVPSKYIIPHMVKQGHGSIINISSLASINTDVTSIAYGTAKNAINHLTKQIAIQYARFGIRCNAVLPGLIATNAVAKHLSEDFVEDFLKMQPIQRMGQPNDIAKTVAFLASDDASFITGQLIAVTGGIDLASVRYTRDFNKIQFDN